MNIENISALMEQLQLLGFENAGYSLLKRISFMPENFILSQKIEKVRDKLCFQLFFEKEVSEGMYILLYYDAILQKATTSIDATINGINTTSLEKSMTEIDWKSAFDFVTKKQLNLEDKSSWEKEQKVESVIESLSELEKSEDGKAVSVGLKIKYWAGIPYQEVFGSISPLKNKSEVCQRFYVFEGQARITVDEAYRFLQNRWLEKQMKAKRKERSNKEISEIEKDTRASNYVIESDYLWNSIAELAKTQSKDLLRTLQQGFKYIENQSFESTFQGLFSEINLDSDKLGKNYEERNKLLGNIIQKIAEGIGHFDKNIDYLGDAYEYLIGKFAAGSGQKAGEFYTPQRISDILSAIVTLDSQDPSKGQKKKIERVLDFACGSGSLLLNVRKKMTDAGGTIGKIFGQEKNITTYNLARMNMLLHDVKDTEFEIHHGDTLLNDWDILNEMNPAKKLEFDAIVANPPFSYRWEPSEVMGQDFRFNSYGLAPKSAADFAFLLHGFHFLSKEGTMAIILPHGVLFRGGSEERIRKKLLQDGNIDTVIGLPANLFFSTGIPVCILVLKKCKKFDDVLFINAVDHFEKEKRQNNLLPENIEKIVETYSERKEETRYSRRVRMNEIENNEFNLNISRYVSTSKDEEIIDLNVVNKKLVGLEEDITKARETHNKYLKELGLRPI